MLDFFFCNRGYIHNTSFVVRKVQERCFSKYFYFLGGCCLKHISKGHVITREKFLKFNMFDIKLTSNIEVGELELAPVIRAVNSSAESSGSISAEFTKMFPFLEPSYSWRRKCGV